ncbi:MAG: urea carboxylase-associated family protein, partial [Gammaproteobacteria bacterium]
MNFDAGRPDGENDSLKSAISADGQPTPGERYRVPPRCGVAVRLKTNQIIEVQNTHGTQVCDFWAFCQADLGEFLSMAHTRTSLQSVFPKVGDATVSNVRRSMFEIIQDTSPGVHDTLMSCCDINRYRTLGCTEYHDNCTDNLRMAMMAIGLKAPTIPDPFNLWMNIPIAKDGQTSFEPTVSAPSDTIQMKALCDVVAVMSACPQDM